MTWNGNLCAYCGKKVLSEDKDEKCCMWCRTVMEIKRRVY